MPESRKLAVGPVFTFGWIFSVVGAIVLLFFAMSTTTTKAPAVPTAKPGLFDKPASQVEPLALQPPGFLPAERVREIQAAGRDILGDQIMAAGDPGYDAVAALMPGMAKPRETIGVKHHPHDIGVAPDGRLELTDDTFAAGFPSAFFEVGRKQIRFGADPAGCSKSLLDGYLPIVLARFEHEGVLYNQTAFGWSEGLRPDADRTIYLELIAQSDRAGRIPMDTDLWAYVELEAVNTGSSRVKMPIHFHVDPENAVNPPLEWKAVLKPGESRSIHLKVPFAIEKDRVEEIGAADYDKALAEVKSFWEADLASGLQINVPEPRVNQAFRAWQAYSALDVDKKKGVLEPHDGSGFYEQVYGYSAALYPHALDLWGRPDEAARVIESLLTLQRPDGLFTSHFGTPDPGTLLFAICEHYDLTGDMEFLRRVAPAMIRMTDWIIAMRKESMTPAGLPKPVTYGLIKFSPYCDFPEPTYDYFGDAYCAVGLERTAKALAEAGMKAESARIAKEGAAYRKDILASMDAAVFERDGLPILPLEPDTHRILKDSQYRAGDYYSLIASCMLESEFLPAGDKRAGWVMRFMEEKGGLRLGMAEFRGGVDHAYTYGYWLNSLKLGRVGPVLLGFYGSLAYGISRETHSGVEVTNYLSGANEPTAPHLYSCTQQLRLLRMMLLREEGEELRILPAAPMDWLGQGKRIEVKGAPTKFGPVSYAVESKIGENKIMVEVEASWRTAPKKIVLRLRRPGEIPIAAVRVDGKPVTTFKGDTIELAAPGQGTKIEVAY